MVCTNFASYDLRPTLMLLTIWMLWSSLLSVLSVGRSSYCRSQGSVLDRWGFVLRVWLGVVPVVRAAAASLTGYWMVVLELSYFPQPYCLFCSVWFGAGVLNCLFLHCFVVME